MEVSSVMLVQAAAGGRLLARTQARDDAIEEEASPTPRENPFSPVVPEAARPVGGLPGIPTCRSILEGNRDLCPPSSVTLSECFWLIALPPAEGLSLSRLMSESGIRKVP